jgi:hypothetical protein
MKNFVPLLLPDSKIFMSIFIKKGRNFIEKVFTFLQKIRPCLQDFFVAHFRTDTI